VRPLAVLVPPTVALVGNHETSYLRPRLDRRLSLGKGRDGVLLGTYRSISGLNSSADALVFFVHKGRTII
jgi:hypothetical protein